MTDGRQIPDRVQWHEGMLLAPQHFQQSDQRLEGLIHYHLQGGQPFFWGVHRLRFDPSLLASGTLRVLELEAVLPDGLLVTDPADDDELLTVNLNDFTEGRPQGSLTVHLVVPSRRDIHAPGAGSLARYRSVDGFVVMDENTEDMAIRIPRLRPRASLLVADQAPEKFTSIPLARISFQEETFSLGSYVPPTPRITASSALGEATARLAGKLREGAAFLSEKIQATGEQEDDVFLDAMQARLEKLSQGLPQLEALLPHGPHPWPLYLTLCQIAGSLAGMQRGVVPPHLEAYDHHDLEASFKPLLSFCLRMTEGVEQRYKLTSFTQDRSTFRLALNEEWLTSQYLVVGVSGGKRLTDPQVVQWMEEARIGSSSVLGSLQARRIRGASRRPIDRDDTLGVYPSRGLQLFHVTVDAEFLKAGDVLEILHPSQDPDTPSPEQIVLFAPVGG
jgi:type VI secretion system protein ImpJ